MVYKLLNHILIICSGEDYDEKKIKNYSKICDYIICADGGLNILDRLSIKPDLIIGDMDSLNNRLIEKYKEINFEKYSTEKDMADSELSLKKAISLNPEKISMFAATGSYFDHGYANVINLIKYYKKKIDLNLITKNSIIMPVVKMKIINNAAGMRFSVFPIGDSKEIKMTGCKYQFKENKKFSVFDYSISNIITENKFVLKIKKGFIVLFNKGYN